MLRLGYANGLTGKPGHMNSCSDVCVTICYNSFSGGVNLLLTIFGEYALTARQGALWGGRTLSGAHHIRKSRHVSFLSQAYRQFRKPVF
jgi:hypothetical protein